MTVPPKTDDQKYCIQCGAVIAKDAVACPSCGAPQAGATTARSTGSKVLIGCLIAAGVVFVGIPMIGGFFAAILIPKFANTKERAYVAAMRSDLRNLVTAEETFFQDSVKYTSQISRLNFKPSTGVSTPVIVTGPGYWTATVTHSQVPGKVCEIAVNTSNTLASTAGDGEPACR